MKKSRFIAYASRASNREQALQQLDGLKLKYPDARHHCWAYLLGNPHSPLSAAMSDDGEPSGTAGKPILNVLQHKQVGDIMLVVVRYFGGIKLGAGGLVRAYSSATQQLMAQLQTLEQITYAEGNVQCHFSQEQPLRHWLGLHSGQLTELHYSTVVEGRIALPHDQVTELYEWANSHAIRLKMNDD